MIAIIDYGMGNTHSLYNSIRYLGEKAVVTRDPRAIDDATHMILPGVGAFGDAMRNLNEMGLTDVLNRQVMEKGKPFLGICLGLQLMSKASHEHGLHRGLGWLDAQAVRFEFKEPGLKVPHMGWNDISLRAAHPLFENLKDAHMSFYFVHSYHVSCNDCNDVLATCDYGITFAASVARDNIFGTQFHPEKSQENGLQVLKNFISWNS